MNETLIGTIPAAGVILIATASWFYTWGGRSGKWKRRFIGALICAAAIWVEALLLGNFHLLLLLLYPLTIATYSLGYGADFIGLKILKRSIVVACSLISGLLMIYIFGGKGWLVFPVEVVVASVTIWLGVKNPIQAPAEEFFVCLFLWSPKLMYPFI